MSPVTRMSAPRNTNVPVHVNTTITLSASEIEALRFIWHVHGWRCRVAVALYGISRRFGRVADRIDPPRRHP